MRRIITFLLGLSLLLGVGGALAAEVVPQDITSIDELPFLAQSRPDMTLPAPLTVTVTEKSILFAPQGGKDIYKKPSLVYRNTGESVAELKWSSKQKAYLFDFAKVGIDPSRLSDLEFVHQQNLKKDNKIVKQLQHRILMHRFSADTGECVAVDYALAFKTKEGMQGHSLIHQANGFYRARAQYMGSAKDISLLFDQEGRKVALPPTPIPDSPGDIQGLPEMGLATISYHFPINLGDRFQVNTEEQWDSVYLVISSLAGSVIEHLRFDDTDGAWVSEPLSEMSSLTEALQYGHLTCKMGLRRTSEEGSTHTAIISFDRPGPYQVVMDFLMESVLERSAHSRTQPDATDASYVHYERINQYGVSDLVAQRGLDQLQVRFCDMAGNLVGEREYPMPPLELPRAFYTVEMGSEWSKLQAASMPGPQTSLSQIFRHDYKAPSWIPVLHEEESQVTIAGMPDDVEFTYIYITLDSLGEEHMTPIYFDTLAKPVPEVFEIEYYKSNSDYFRDLVFYIESTDAHTSWNYNLQLKTWVASSMGIQEPGSPYRYSVTIDYQEPIRLLTCWGEIGEESKALWSAYCDEQGKILFGTLGMKNLTDE